MRTLATDATADQLLDYLASDGAGGEWTYYADLAGRGLAEIRRAAQGMQLRLTTEGEQLAQHREQAARQAVADLDWGRMLNPPANLLNFPTRCFRQPCMVW